MLITNLGEGGAQRVFHDHAVAFREFSFVSEVVYSFSTGSSLHDPGLHIQELRINGYWSMLGPLGRLFGRAIALSRLVKSMEVDLVISHMDGANWVNVLSFSTAQKILVVHGTILHDQKMRGLTQFARLRIVFPCLYNLANYTVAVSEGIRRELKSVGRVRNVVAIPNFFNIESIQDQSRLPIPGPLELAFGVSPLLVSSGRLAEQKKQVFAIEILSALRRRHSTAKLVILGDGELRQDLVNKCIDLNLSYWAVWEKTSLDDVDNNADVYFLGYVSNPYQYLRRATLFLFPSAWEGFPLALCEAMLCGSVAVSADCPTGPREILAPGTFNDTYESRAPEFTERGVLMPMITTSADIELWVDTVAMLLLDDQLRQSMATSAAEAMKSLDRRMVLQHWKSLIERSTDAR